MVLYEVSKKKILKGLAGATALAGSAYTLKKAYDTGEETLYKKYYNQELNKVNPISRFVGNLTGGKLGTSDEEIAKMARKDVEKAGILPKISTGFSVWKKKFTDWLDRTPTVRKEEKQTKPTASVASAAAATKAGFDSSKSTISTNNPQNIKLNKPVETSTKTTLNTSRYHLLSSKEIKDRLSGEAKE